MNCENMNESNCFKTQKQIAELFFLFVFSSSYVFKEKIISLMFVPRIKVHTHRQRHRQTVDCCDLSFLFEEFKIEQFFIQHV